MPDIAILKKFALIDPTADSAVLELCMNAAIDWYHGAGVANEATGPLWDLAVYYLASWYNENRGAIGDTAAPLPDVAFSHLNSLRFRTWPAPVTEPVPEEGEVP